MYNLDRLLKIYQHLLYQYYLIGRIAKDSTFSIFNVWDTFILKQVLIVYLKLKFTWRILGFFVVVIIVCCYVVCVLWNLTTLPVDLYGSTIGEPLVSFITRITEHKQHLVPSGRKRIAFLWNYP